MDLDEGARSLLAALRKHGLGVPKVRRQVPLLPVALAESLLTLPHPLH